MSLLITINVSIPLRMCVVKKIMGVCLLLLVAVSSVQAQSFESMVKRFEEYQKAECFHVGPFMMRIAKAFVSKKEMDEMDPMGRAMLEHVKHLTLLDLSDCSEEDKETFRKAVEMWVPEGYEAVDLNSDDSGAAQELDLMRCFVRITDKRTYELIILDLQAYQCTQMKGTFSEEIIQQIIDQKKSEPKS